jgi:hypothetical protein
VIKHHAETATFYKQIFNFGEDQQNAMFHHDFIFNIKPSCLVRGTAIQNLSESESETSTL